jgi:hypothetical protein
MMCEKYGHTTKSETMLCSWKNSEKPTASRMGWKFQLTPTICLEVHIHLNEVPGADKRKNERYKFSNNFVNSCSTSRMINVLDRQNIYTAFVNEQKRNQRIIEKDILSPQRDLNNGSRHFLGGSKNITPTLNWKNKAGAFIMWTIVSEIPLR